MQGCRETGSKETRRKGKIREPLVHCYSFSCGDIVKFPQGWRHRRRDVGKPAGVKKKRKVEAKIWCSCYSKRKLSGS